MLQRSHSSTYFYRKKCLTIATRPNQWMELATPGSIANTSSRWSGAIQPKVRTTSIAWLINAQPSCSLGRSGKSGCDTAKGMGHFDCMFNKCTTLVFARQEWQILSPNDLKQENQRDSRVCSWSKPSYTKVYILTELRLHSRGPINTADDPQGSVTCQ